MKIEENLAKIEENHTSAIKKPTFNLERCLKLENIVGIDEVGCGPWAGPVVVAGVSFPKIKWDFLEKTLLINDSKKLSALKRHSFFEAIKHHGSVQIGAASVDEIDQMNIVKATELATKRMLLKFGHPFQMALIDGIRKPRIDIPTTMIIKGDQKSFSIAAASIIAKVTRDFLMEKMGRRYPHYGFEKHAGYGTKQHQEALKTYGVTIHHRKSYAPIKRILESL